MNTKPSRFRRLLPALLALLLWPAATHAAEPADPSAHYVGMNLWFLNDWDGSNAFANILMHARNWQKRNWSDGNATIDAEGWPLEDASTVIFGADNQLGTYKLFVEGQVDSISMMWTSGSVSNIVYNATTNTTTADVTLTNNNTGGLTLSNTRRTAASALNTGFRNLRLYRPGHATDGSELFDQRFIALMAPFHVIRYMDWVDANKNGEVSWASRWRPGMAKRPTYEHQGQSGLTYGIPLEYMIALSNQLGADMWLNIPTWADDDYVTQTALALKYGTDGVNPYTSPQANPVWPPLNPNLKVYVEWANEVWNSAPGFRCFPWVLGIADTIIADPEPHPTKLNTTTGAYDVTDRYTLQARYTAYRSVQISDLFRAVHGDEAMNSRIRVTLMGQIGGNYFNPRQLPWLDAFYNRSRPESDPFPNATPRPLTHFLYSAGGSAYYGVNTWSTDPDVFFAPGNYPSASWMNAVGIDAVRARNYGLVRQAYEGGMGLDIFNRTGYPTASNEEKEALNADPRMKTLVEAYHDAWTRMGGDLLTYYVNTSALDWEFTPNVNTLDTPKLNAARSIMTERSRVPVTLGQEIPGFMVARDHTLFDTQGGFFNATSSTGLDVVGGFDPTDFRAYPLNTRAFGSYRIRLRAGTNTATTIQVHLNGVPVGTISFSGTSQSLMQDTPWLTLPVTEEFNVLRLTCASGRFYLYGIEAEYLGLAIGPGTLNDAIPGMPYSVQLQGSGGTPPYAWSLSDGALPSGLSLHPSTGLLSGTPSSESLASFTVQITDSAASPASATRAYTLQVTAPDETAPTLSFTAPAANSIQGPAFSVTGTASDPSGIASVQWRINGGAWQPASGTGSWTAALSSLPHGSLTFEVRATDAAPAANISAPLSRSFTVDAQPPVLSGLSATPDRGSALIAFTTDETATARVRYGTTSGSLDSATDYSSAASTHSIPLAGLTPDTPYFYRVDVLDSRGNAAQSQENTFTTLPLGPARAAPIFSTAAGSYASPITVALSTASANASIRYTTDGSTPTATHGLLYTAPFALGASATVRAIAYADGYTDSPVSSAAYVITSGSGTPGAYTALNSTQPGGPAFLWHDTSTAAGGTRIWGTTNIDDTNVALSFPSGFTFPFYGTAYNSIRVCSNGFLSLTSTLNAYNNTALPSTSAPPSLIAPYWTDLYLTANSSSVTWRRIDDDTLAITFDKARRYASRSDSTLYITFQAVLHRDGRILFNYKDNLYDNSLYTLGIQNQDRTEALQVSYNSDYLPTGTAVNFAVQIAQGSTAATAPAATPAPGTFSTPPQVSLISATEGASIRYTTDGSTPTPTTGTVYSAPFDLAASTTVNAIAILGGMDPSAVTTFEYILDLTATYTLAYTAATGGTISGSSPQTVASGSDGSTVTAVPDSGYSFTQWSDGLLTASRTDTNVQSDLSVTAQFSVITASTALLDNNFNTVTVGTYDGGSTTGPVPGADFGAEATLGNATTNRDSLVSATGGVGDSARLLGTSNTASVAIRSRNTVNIQTIGTVSFHTAFQYRTQTNAGGFIGMGFALPAGADGSNPTDSSTSVHRFLIGVRTLNTTDGSVNFSAGGTVSSGSIGGTLPANAMLTPDAWYSLSFDLTFTYDSVTPANSTYTLQNALLKDSSGNTILALGADRVITPTTYATNLFTNPNAYAVVLSDYSRGGLALDNVLVTTSGDSEPPATFTLTYIAGPGGTIFGSSPQTVASGASGSTVTAVADSGYSFTQWSDGILTASRSDSNIQSDLSVTAQFTPVANPGAPFVRLYILSGQSNMGLGTPPIALTGADTDVWFDNTAATTVVGSRQTAWLRVRMPAEGGEGIQAGAAEVFQARHPADRIAILKVSQGATGISYWNTPGELGYEALMERIDTVLARLNAQITAGDISGFSVEGFLWMQGEAEIDATISRGAERYYYSLLSLLDSVRSRAAAPALPAAIGRTSWIFAPETLRPDNAALPGAGDLRQTGLTGRVYTSAHEFVDTGLPRGRTMFQGYNLMVRNGQMLLGREPGVNAGWADADDLPVTDYFHLVPGAAGAVTLGRRLGRELLRRQGDSVPAELTVHAGPHRWAHPGTLTFTPALTNLNGETPSYLWELVTGPAAVSFSPDNTLNTSVALNTPGTYALRVTVTTPTRSHRHTVNVIVLPADQNLPAYGYADPIFVDAPLQRVPISATVINPDGDPLTTTWTRQIGSGLVTIENPATISTHARFHAPGSYTLRLALDDGTPRADGNSSGWILLPVTVGRAGGAEHLTYAARFPFEETDFFLGETYVPDNQQLNLNVTRSTEARVGTGAGSFNGTNAYLQTDRSAFTNLFPHGNQAARSFAAWIRPASPATGTQVIYDQGGGTNAFTLRLSGGQLQAGYNGNNGLVSIQTPAPAANTWTHIAAVANSATQTLTLYVNGSPAASLTDAKVTTSGTMSGAAALGARLATDAFTTTGTVAADFYNGLIDEARAYETALTPEQIAALAAMGATATLYETWATANNIQGGPTDLTDGIPNLLRYALNGDAATPAASLRLTPAATSGGMTLDFPRVSDPSLLYEIWATDDLLDWGASALWTGDWNDPLPTLIPAPANQLFLHLRVRQP